MDKSCSTVRVSVTALLLPSIRLPPATFSVTVLPGALRLKIRRSPEISVKNMSPVAEPVSVCATKLPVSSRRDCDEEPMLPALAVKIIAPPEIRLVAEAPKIAFAA